MNDKDDQKRVLDKLEKELEKDKDGLLKKIFGEDNDDGATDRDREIPPRPRTTG